MTGPSDAVFTGTATIVDADPAAVRRIFGIPEDEPRHRVVIRDDGGETRLDAVCHVRSDDDGQPVFEPCGGEPNADTIFIIISKE